MPRTFFILFFSCMHKHTYVNVYIHTYTCVYINTYIFPTYAYICLHRYIGIYTFVYVIYLCKELFHSWPPSLSNANLLYKCLFKESFHSLPRDVWFVDVWFVASLSFKRKSKFKSLAVIIQSPSRRFVDSKKDHLAKPERDLILTKRPAKFKSLAVIIQFLSLAHTHSLALAEPKGVFHSPSSSLSISVSLCVSCQTKRSGVFATSLSLSLSISLPLSFFPSFCLFMCLALTLAEPEEAHSSPPPLSFFPLLFSFSFSLFLSPSLSFSCFLALSLSHSLSFSLSLSLSLCFSLSLIHSVSFSLALAEPKGVFNSSPAPPSKSASTCLHPYFDTNVREREEQKACGSELDKNGKSVNQMNVDSVKTCEMYVLRERERERKLARAREKARGCMCVRVCQREKAVGA